MDAIEILRIAAQIFALLIAIIGHEIMHGAAAYYYGDLTAKMEGRLSVNPIRHVDLLGTIVLPILLLLSGSPFLFGWAKPVPIDVRRVLLRGNMAMVVVSLAGIFYNLVLAIGCALILNFFGESMPDFLIYLLIYLTMWNIILAIFNLLPIPPLDGSNAIAYGAAALGFYGVARFFNHIGMYGFIILVVVVAAGLTKPIFRFMYAIIHFLIPDYV
jgi:Zn-dependent protease